MCKMSLGLEKEAVVRAIRVLRQRRVRPCVDKIAWFVRRDNLSQSQTETILDALVESEDVLRVVYKGATSYRIAKSWCKTPCVKNHPTRTKVRVMNSESTGRILRDIVTSFGATTGATSNQIAVRLEELGHQKLTQRLELILYREVRAGTLQRVETTSGNSTVVSYIPCASSDAPPSPLSEDEVASEESPSEDRSNGEEIQSPAEREAHKEEQPSSPVRKRGRPRTRPEPEFTVPRPPARRGRPPSSRNKKARQVYDPSDHDPTPRKQSFPPRCDVCALPHNSRNPSEVLLICQRCGTHAHPTCLGYNADLAFKSRLRPWTCMDCKLCSLCNMDHTVATLVFCDRCDRAFHLCCHKPPLAEPMPDAWICCVCTGASSNGLDSMLTPRDSPVRDDESRGSSGFSDHGSYDGEVPNASQWSVDEVVTYFSEKGFQAMSHAFKDQDVDGASLLLLSRADVLTGLKLKLGPALKIYRHVRMLQTRMLNPPLT